MAKINMTLEEFQALLDSVGKSSDLSTTQKDTLVQAINETYAKTVSDKTEVTNEISTKIGTLSSLKTSAKNNMVSALNELFQSVSDGKSTIAGAITDKGGSASATSTFAAMATAIRRLPLAKSKVAIGEFEASNSSYKIITFDKELDAVPDFICFFNNSSSYYSSNRVRFAAGVSSSYDMHLGSGSSASNSMNVYGSGSTNNVAVQNYNITTTTSNTGTSYPSIRNATKSGFEAYAATSSYYLRGDYLYIAVCF